jgi:uncharacterized repeat protein (TIGR03803 family)
MWILVAQAPAQTFRTLCSFTPHVRSAGIWDTNSSGAAPKTDLVLSGNTLYGTTFFAGTNGRGTIFALNTDGTDFRTLHTFTSTNSPDLNIYVINSDGAHPSGGLLLLDNILYGTASNGGPSANGTVFALNTDGTGFRALDSFAGPNFSDGRSPEADLVLSGNTLYGTCYIGGTNLSGTVFAVNTDGTGFRVLHNFSPYTSGYTNSDGGAPRSGLVLSGNTLYGAASVGGSLGNGTVFAINTDGTGFTNLHTFTGGRDGANPIGNLLLSGRTLYGAASYGGSSGNGTVFAINTDGASFTTLHSFTARSDNSDFGTNSDGGYPLGNLVLLGNTLYGATSRGGSFGWGTVFSVNVDGTAFTTIYAFTDKADGANPNAGLILSGNTLYGTTYDGGTFYSGTVFSITLPPPLTLTPLGTNLILSWPTNLTGYTLRCTTNLTSPVWTPLLTTPTVNEAQNTVTTPLSGSQQFYRLSQ